MTRITDTQKKSRSHHSLNPNRPNVNNDSSLRTKGTIKRLQMYRSSKARRNKDGKIIKPAAFQSHVECGTRARIEPSRTWFANSKVISQSKLQNFEAQIDSVKNDPYKVLMKKTELPVTLLRESAKRKRNHILDTEPFETVFGKKSQRKRPHILKSSLNDLIASVESAQSTYDPSKDGDLEVEDDGTKIAPREIIFGAGQSKRIWNELYKVIDSSDVVVQVMDARNPLGTRCPAIESYMKKEKSHKHMIFVLNKVDLVPTWVTQKWVAMLSAEAPTIAFHASVKHPFGKGALINLFRQFSKLHGMSKQISIGFIGYPNVGKSSVINTLRAKKVCNVAPIAGETKVWQYITLMKKIYLIDCPGIVVSSEDSDEDKVLNGAVRVELVADPYCYIPAILTRIKQEYLERTYKIRGWKDANEFLEKLAQKSGKLLKGGEPDLNTVSKSVLNDWQRGKLPYFVPPPGCTSLKPEPELKFDVQQDLSEIVPVFDEFADENKEEDSSTKTTATTTTNKLQSESETKESSDAEHKEVEDSCEKNSDKEITEDDLEKSTLKEGENETSNNTAEDLTSPQKSIDTSDTKIESNNTNTEKDLQTTPSASSPKSPSKNKMTKGKKMKKVKSSSGLFIVK
uniref:Nucleolar GTP-binding protein 2 n=1 Tax=Lepeophtheirus salmonis TaxID=72036 RepID=A0A0K2TLI4_LEPSM